MIILFFFHLRCWHTTPSLLPYNKYLYRNMLSSRSCEQVVTFMYVFYVQLQMIIKSHCIKHNNN